MEQDLEWGAQCREAVKRLQLAVKQAKCHRAKCCQVLAAALAAHLAVEHAVHHGGFSTTQTQQLQGLCAATVATIELAHQRIKVMNTGGLAAGC